MMDEIFVIKQVESSSPISKRPGTPFRNSSLFLSEVPCVGSEIKEGELIELKPTDVPVLPVPTFEPCIVEPEVPVDVEPADPDPTNPIDPTKPTDPEPPSDGEWDDINREPTPGECKYVGELKFGDTNKEQKGCNIYKIVGKDTASVVLEFDGNSYGEPDEFYVFDGDPREGGTLLGSVDWKKDGQFLFSQSPTYFYVTTTAIDLYIQTNRATDTNGDSQYTFRVRVHQQGTTNPTWIELPNELTNPWA